MHHLSRTVVESDETGNGYHGNGTLGKKDWEPLDYKDAE